MTHALRHFLTALVLVSVLACGCLPTGSGPTDEEKETHFLAGKTRVSEMDYKGAIACFEKALEVNARSAAAHFELGWLFDVKEVEPATAIYHYSSYLQLRPHAENQEMVKTRIMACKQELARTVSLGPVTQSMQREYEKLTEENKKLKEELEAVKAHAAWLQGLTNAASAPAVASRENMGNPQPSSSGAFTPPRRTAGNDIARTSFVANQPSGRTHNVKPGENATTIAKKYGVKVEALLAANPRLDTRRMQVGQAVSIPASQ